MKNKKIIIALGGNAILTDDPTAKAQKQALDDTAKKLMQLIKAGNELIISHGNGPQVGNLMLQHLKADSPTNPSFPLDSLGAMTQGSIGYWLVNALQSSLKEEGIEKEAVAVITQSIVDENDPAFDDPTKPVGPFLTKEEADAATKDGEIYKEDAGRGYRRVVASPKPILIKEAPVIKQLVNAGVLTVSSGGGGIPVVERDGRLVGVEAVIDKDYATAKLAELVDADVFIVLTGVDNVYVNYNQPDQKKLENVTVNEMKQYIAEDQFAPGSMLPKVEAAISFVENGPTGSKTIITSLENLEAVINESGGTVITK